MLLAQLGGDIGHWAVLIIIIAAVIAVVFVVTQQMGVAVPAWVITIFWIIVGPAPTVKQGLTAVFLDPPYADTANRDSDLYRTDSESVAHEVRAWAIENGGNSQLRIALCGYVGEHEMPSDWECLPWKAKGGYAGQGKGDNENARKERIWFSPHCVKQVKRAKNRELEFA